MLLSFKFILTFGLLTFHLLIAGSLGFNNQMANNYHIGASKAKYEFSDEGRMSEEEGYQPKQSKIQKVASHGTSLRKVNPNRVVSFHVPQIALQSNNNPNFRRPSFVGNDDIFQSANDNANDNILNDNNDNLMNEHKIVKGETVAKSKRVQNYPQNRNFKIENKSFVKSENKMKNVLQNNNRIDNTHTMTNNNNNDNLMKQEKNVFKKEKTMDNSYDNDNKNKHNNKHFANTNTNAYNNNNDKKKVRISQVKIHDTSLNVNMIAACKF